MTTPITNNDRVIKALLHLALYQSHRAIQEAREGNLEASRRYRSNARWHWEWAARRADDDGQTT